MYQLYQLAYNIMLWLYTFTQFKIITFMIIQASYSHKLYSDIIEYILCN